MKILLKKVGKLTGRFSKTSEPLFQIPSAFALIGVLIAPNVSASQSSIEAKSGYNSLRQFSSSILGTWGTSDRAFLDLSVTHLRTPTVTLKRTDHFTQGTLGAGYTVDSLGFDAGINGATQPLEGIHSIGGYLGITYFHVPGSLIPDEDAGSDGTLGLLHTQTYIHPTQELPVFWIRLGYAINSMTSDLLNPPDNGGKDTTLSADGYYSVNSELVVGAGFGLHIYDQQRNVFKSAVQNSQNSYLNLLTSTIMGFPKTTIAFNATWQIAVRDSLLPRYQLTELEASRVWTQTIDLGWRHQFSKQFYLTPTYEVSFQADLPSTGLLLSLLYTL